MPTYLLVGIPVAIIGILGGLVVYERHTEKAHQKKRENSLKRWAESQDPPPSSGESPGS
jgi:hypothetical protein